jgi:hypothetical protein
VLAVVLVGVSAVTGRATGAQEAPAALDGQPLVGAWILDNNADDPANAPELVVFSGDGTYLGAPFDGGTTVGVWEPTGERTAAITLVFLTPGADGAFGGMATVRGTVEVAEDGLSFTAPYTLEFAEPGGGRSGEFGPATATGTRMAIEPMGTPVGSLNDLFGAMAATPSP